MKSKLLLLFIVCLSLMPLVTFAECADSRMVELNKIASNVKFSYSYDVDGDGNPQFKVIITNVTPDIFVVDSLGNEYRNFENVSSSNYTEFDIYSNDPSCSGKILTRYLQIPNFNSFSKLKECDNNSSRLCNIWSDTGFYDDEDFIEELNNENKKEQENSFDDDSQNSDINMSFFVVTGVLFFCLVVILTIIIIKRKG